MSTKKQNRRYVVRKVRRALKDVSLDVGVKLSGKLANGAGYGIGIKKTDFARGKILEDA